MKILIESSQIERLKNYITSYLDMIFIADELYWTYDHDEDGNPDENKYIFYRGDFSNQDIVFEWIGENYFDSEELKKNAPIVLINTEQVIDLESMFGDFWKPVFKKWFKENFNLDVKTVNKE